MKNNIKCYGVLYIALISLIACDQLIEPSLENKEILLRAPSNQAELESGEIIFYWDSMPGSRYYNVQIIRGDFNSIINLIIDSNTSRNKLTILMNQGVYKWRVRGHNQSTNSKYSSTNTLIVK